MRWANLHRRLRNNFSSRILSAIKEGLVKPVHFVCVCLMLAGTIVLAQFGPNRLVNQASGLPFAQEQQPGLPPNLSHLPEGVPFAQRHSGLSRRRRAKSQVQNGPEQVLYAFQSGNDGQYPSSGLIFDASGNLYGETEYGGGGACNSGIGDGCGTVFELSPNGNGGWTETVLHSFQCCTDGNFPASGLIFDQAGNLYGTTFGGGTYNQGTVFELTPSPNGGWSETVLFSFSDEGGLQAPQGVIFDQKGNLYGTAIQAGECGHYSTCGGVFELSPNPNGGWTGTVLYTFQPSGGWGPSPGLVLDRAGNLYGTTFRGGSSGCSVDENSGCGTVFQLSPHGSGGWTETALYIFQGENDGGNPAAGLIFDQSGNLYGTTQLGGGTGCSAGCGTVFELSPTGGGAWTENVLYSFEGGSDGNYPDAGLIFDINGNLYSTSGGGDSACLTSNGYGCGTTFELSPNSNGGWTETVLYRFQGGNDGEVPLSGVILDQTGNLYGTTNYGGGTGCTNTGCGVVYEVTRESFVTLSPTSLSFGNQTVGISSSPQAATLTNSGNLPLTITSIEVTGADSSDFGQTNNCPSSLPPSGSCNISVTFAPEATGNRSAAISVTDNAPGSPQSLPLSGVGVLPAVTFSPTSLNFGSQTVGSSSSPLKTTLTNTGQGVLTIASIGIAGTNSNEFAQTNNCPASLSPNANCSVSVTFTPTAVGNANASVTVADNAPGSPQTVPLSGAGITGISFSPPTVTFPNQYVGTSGLPQTVTLKNTGDAVITIANVKATPSDFAPLSSCGNSVEPGATCSIGVFFDPTTSGTRDGVLSVTDSASGSPQTVPLSGTGQDFTLAASSPSTATVAPGQAGKYTVAVAPGGGFNQNVTLTCSGAPAQSTCSVSPSSVTLNGTAPAPVSVTVTTAGTSASLAQPSALPPGRGMLALWLAFSGLPGLVLLGGRSRKRDRGLFYGAIFSCVLFGLMTLSACGGGNSMGSSAGGSATPAGSYNLTVVGTFSSGSANLVHSTKLMLVVQ
jgi:uncharacterized repeat protein (TIGR03803 family)